MITEQVSIRHGSLEEKRERTFVQSIFLCRVTFGILLVGMSGDWGYGLGNKPI